MVLRWKKERIRRYPAETKTNADYADNLALLENASTQAESLLLRQEQTVGGIGLYANTNITEYMCFK